MAFLHMLYFEIMNFMCYEWNKFKGSVPLRPGEKIRKLENQKFVHCLASMCSSIVFNSLMKKIPMFKIEYISSYTLSEWGYWVNIEIPLRLSPASTFRAFKKYERSDVTFSHLWI